VDRKLQERIQHHVLTPLSKVKLEDTLFDDQRMSVVWPPRDIGLAIVLMFIVLFSVEAKPFAAWRTSYHGSASDIPVQPCNLANFYPFCGECVGAVRPEMMSVQEWRFALR
jgi:hypothetical protein